MLVRIIASCVYLATDCTGIARVLLCVASLRHDFASGVVHMGVDLKIFVKIYFERSRFYLS